MEGAKVATIPLDTKTNTTVDTHPVKEKKLSNEKINESNSDRSSQQNRNDSVGDSSTSDSHMSTSKDETTVVNRTLTKTTTMDSSMSLSQVQSRNTMQNPEFAGFTIKLDNDRWLTPGEALKGSLAVPKWLQNREFDYSVHLVLQGRSKVKTITGHGKSRSVNRSRAAMLYEVVDLPYRQGSTWDFRIDVPAESRQITDIKQLEMLNQNAQLKRSKWYWTPAWPSPTKAGDADFNGAWTQPLPPTYHTFIKTHYSIWVNTEYALSAYVMRPKPPKEGTFSRLFGSSSSRIEYGPLQPLEVCRHKLVVPGSNELATAQGLAETNLVQNSITYIPASPTRTNSTVLSRIPTNKQSQPSQTLDISVTLPSLLQPATPLDLVISLKTLLDPSLLASILPNNETSPGGSTLIPSSEMPIDLKSISVKLKRLTNVRTRAGWKDKLKYTKHWCTVYHEIGDLNPEAASEDFSHWKLAADPSSTSTGISKEEESGNKQLEKTITWTLPAIPSQQPTTFATFNVFVAYKLSLLLTFVTAKSNKQHKLKLRSPVTMVAGDEVSIYKGDNVPNVDVRAVAATMAIKAARALGGVAEIVGMFAG